MKSKTRHQTVHLPASLYGIFIFLLILTTLAFTQVPSNLSGTIAYFKNGTELRLVNPDGSNDFVIWTNPVGEDPYLSKFIDWRPDGQEIAFSSKHELNRSVYISDIYGIKPDGTGLRRITNSPKFSELSNFPKGNVQITILNTISNASNFFLYVAGADSAEHIVLDAGFQQTYTIPGIADFGEGFRQGVVVYDPYDGWHFVGIPLDVVAGQTITHPGTVTLGNNHVSAFNAITPSWKRDGSELAFDLGNGPARRISANPAYLSVGDSIFPDVANVFVRYLAWSPVSDEFVYGERYGLEANISKALPGSNEVTPLVGIGSDLCEGISWLPDGSGFVFCVLDALEAYAHLYLFKFNSGITTQLTNFTDELALRPSVSPDGQYISFTKYTKATSSFEIYAMSIDGSTSWRVAENGDFSDWGAGEGDPPTPGETELRNFDLQNSQQLLVTDNSNNFVHGPNSYGDIAKATAYHLPPGQTNASISEVKVWFAYKKTGLSNEMYNIEIYNGDETTGPTGAALFSQSFLMTNINADDNVSTVESATLHTLSPPVNVGATFFVAVNFGNYTQDNINAISIAVTQEQGKRISEDWEMWSDATWHNISDAWYGDSSPNSGTNGWWMWIEASSNTATSVEGVPLVVSVPSDFELKQNYPNPFNPLTTIEYSIPNNENVTLKVYDLLGAEVATLVQKNQTAGKYTVEWDASYYSSGIFYYVLQAGEFAQYRKMILLK